MYHYHLNYFSGAFLPWRLAIFIPVIISIPTFIFILFLHESPAWLRQKGRIEEYQKSMEFYKKCEVNWKTDKFKFFYINWTAFSRILKPAKFKIPQLRTRRRNLYWTTSSWYLHHSQLKTNHFGQHSCYSVHFLPVLAGVASQFCHFMQQRYLPNQGHPSQPLIPVG